MPAIKHAHIATNPDSIGEGPWNADHVIEDASIAVSKLNFAVEVPLTFSTGLTRVGNTISATGGGGSGTVTSVGLVGTANQLTVTGTSPITASGSWTLSIPSSAQLSIAKLTNLTGNGFVKTSGSDGTLSIDTSTYLTTAVTSIAGTTNQISASAATGAVTLSIPSSAQLSIAKLTNLTGNGFVKTSGGDGTLSIDTSTYLVSGGALGTPSSGTLTNATGLPAAGVVGTAAILGANTFTGIQTITPAVNAKALIVTGVTHTADSPILDLAQTWNNSGVTFTGIKLNVTATALSESKLLDLQVGGASYYKFLVDSSGNGSFQAVSPNASTSQGFGLIVNGDTSTRGFFGIDSATGNSVISFGPGNAGRDVFLRRDAAGVFAQRNSTNAQNFRVYNTYTDASNNEYLQLGFTSNVATISTVANGSGTARNIGLTPAGGTVTITGALVSTGRIKAPDGSAAAPGFHFTTLTTTGIFYNGGALSISSGGNEVAIYGTDYHTLRSDTKFGWISGTGALGAPDTAFARNAAGVIEINSGTAGTFRDLKLRNVVGQTGYTEMVEMTAPAAGATNSGRIFLEDNGSGKTRCMIQFATGAAQQIAIEP